MATLVDTSALYALLAATDIEHARARTAFEQLLEADTPLVTHNYVLVETTALVQRRLGIAAVRALRDDLLPVMVIDWIERALHERALAATLAAERREVSLVDRVSFELMRQRGIRVAFALDDHFEREGFTTVP